MKTLNIASQIIFRMISYGTRFGLIAGIAYGVPVAILYALLDILLQSGSIQPVGVILIPVPGIFFGALFGLISGFLLSILVGLITSIITVFYIATRRYDGTYRRVILIFSLGICLLVGVGGTLLVYTSRYDIPLIIILWVIPTMIASVICFRAVQNVVTYCTDRFTDNPVFFVNADVESRTR